LTGDGKIGRDMAKDTGQAFPKRPYTGLHISPNLMIFNASHCFYLQISLRQTVTAINFSADIKQL